VLPRQPPPFWKSPRAQARLLQLLVWGREGDFHHCGRGGMQATLLSSCATCKGYASRRIVQERDRLIRKNPRP